MKKRITVLFLVCLIFTVVAGCGKKPKEKTSLEDLGERTEYMDDAAVTVDDVAVSYREAMLYLSPARIITPSSTASPPTLPSRQFCTFFFAIYEYKIKKSCPTRVRTWTLLIQSQSCCQLHHWAFAGAKIVKKSERLSGRQNTEYQDYKNIVLLQVAAGLHI